MNFFNLLIGHTPISLFIQNKQELDFETVSDQLKKEGLLIIHGKASQLKKIADLIEKQQNSNNSKIRSYLFAIISPSFPKSGIAVPLNSKEVLRSAFQQLYLYKGRSLRNKLKIRILMILNYEFLYNKIFRRQFLIITDLSKDSLFSFLNLNLNLGSELIFSIYSGSRKFLLPLFKIKDGEVVGYAKVYLADHKSSGENEAKKLKYLEKLSFQKVYFPKVLCQGYVGDFLVIVLSSLDNLSHVMTITQSHIEFLKGLVMTTGEKINFEDSEFYLKLKNEVAFLRSKAPYKFYLVDYFYKKAMANLANKKIIFSLTMREFPYFHALKWRDSLFVLDWEQAQFSYPPIFDVFSLFLSTVKSGRDNSIKRYEKDIKGIFFSKNELISKYNQEILKNFQLTPVESFWFFWLFIIDTLYMHYRDDHYLSATKVMYFLEKAYKKENLFKQNWLGVGK